MAARDRIREYLEQHVGKVVTTKALRRVGGISEYARRIRELRDEEGMQIQSHRDRDDLKPGEYVLVSHKRRPVVGRAISPQLRSEILERNGFTCQNCGSGPGDSDPTHPGRKLSLQIDHVVPVTQGGTSDKDNLRVLCSACNQARSNVQTASETAVNLLARIRRTSKAVQREVYEALKRRFGDDNDLTRRGAGE